MITLSGTDIFESDADAIVIPVNCMGVMGRGLAREFARRHPRGEAIYKKKVKDGLIRIGTCQGGTNFTTETAFIFFPTKDDWRKPSELSYIKSGLRSLVGMLGESGIRSIAIPPIGCGLGGLKWNSVEPLIFNAFLMYPEIEVQLYGTCGIKRTMDWFRPEHLTIASTQYLNEMLFLKDPVREFKEIAQREVERRRAGSSR